MADLREQVAVIIAEAIEEAGGAVFGDDVLNFADRILALPGVADGADPEDITEYR